MSYKSNIENLTIDATGKLSSPTGVIAGAGVLTLDASAILEADSTTKGFLPPRMTTAQRNAISSPSEGLVVYNTDTDNLNFYSGIAWKEATIDPTSNGLVVRTNSGASSSRTITAGSGISVSNGDGVSGNPTISTTTVAFSGFRSAGNYSLAGTSQTVTWNGVVVDTHSSYSGTNYVVPISGLYEATAYVLFDPVTAGDPVYIELTMGSTTKSASLTFNSSNGGTVIVSQLRRLNAGEAIYVVVGSNGSADAIMNLSGVNSFMIKRVGN